MKEKILNLIIAAEGFLLLTHGPHRQAFFQMGNHFMRNEEPDQELVEAIMILFSLAMMSIILTNSIIVKVFSIMVYAIYTCFINNMVVAHGIYDIRSFLTNLFVLCFALSANIDIYLAEEEAIRDRSRSRRNANMRISAGVMED